MESSGEPGEINISGYSSAGSSYSVGQTIDTLYIPGFDGLGDGIGSPIVTPAASATILVPEPGVAGLLLGALSALVAVRRRRS